MYLETTKVKQNCLPTIMSNVSVSLTSFQKPQLQSVSILFNFVQAYLLLYFVLFNPSFNVLSGYFCFTISGGSSQCLNFEKFRDKAPLTRN